MTGTRILLIEDEDAIGEALVYQLRREGHEVMWSTDGAEGLRLFAQQKPNIVILDLMLPSLSGEAVCESIRRTSSIPIIMLTAKGAESDRVAGLELGADDYVTKPFSTRELIARIQAILRRSRPAAEDAVLSGGRIRLDPRSFTIEVEGEPVHLAPKEFHVLALLMSNPDRALTREELIEKVWGADYFGDTRTLDVHVKRLRKKCEADPHAPRHLQTVRGVGYKFVP